MSNWNNNFTLFDIFGNRQLKDKLPNVTPNLILKNDDVRFRASVRDINGQVFLQAFTIGAKYYSPFKPSVSVNRAVLDGSSSASLDDIQNAVYQELLAKKDILVWTANNMEMIASAIADSENEKLRNGASPKLYLRAGSMQEIAGMSKKQMEGLMKNIMENIYFNPQFAKTQEKYRLYEQFGANPTLYLIEREKWYKKVGYKR